MPEPNRSIEQYKLEEILLESGDDRYPPLELTRAFLSADIYESLDKPYITADLALLDNRDWYEKYDILGGEKIFITFSSKKTRNGYSPIKKCFYIKEVVSNERVDDSNQVVVLSLIEDVAYISNLQNLNRFYEGKGSEIIEKIALEFLERTMSFGTDGPNDQQIYNIIVPNLDPLQACKWIVDRLSTDKGFPFFLYSSLFTDQLIVRDLEQLLKSNVASRAIPYKLGQGSQMNAMLPFMTRKTIISYKLGRSEDLFKLITNGNIGSSYSYLNTALPDASTEIKFDYDIVKDTLKPALDASVLPIEQQNPGYTPAFKYEDKPFNEIQSRNFALLGGSNPFRVTRLPVDGSLPQYPLALGEAYDEAQYKLFVGSRAIKNLLVKAPVTITVPAIDFIDGETHTTTGTQIRVEFEKTDFERKKEYEKRVDSKISGNYLIYRSRHILKPDRYDLALTMVKLGSEGEV